MYYYFSKMTLAMISAAVVLKRRSEAHAGAEFKTSPWATKKKYVTIILNNYSYQRRLVRMHACNTRQPELIIVCAHAASTKGGIMMLIAAYGQTDGRTDGQTDGWAGSMSAHVRTYVGAWCTVLVLLCTRTHSSDNKQNIF